MKQWKE
jgi:hypothetical protein